jgi:hypothetical protein
MSLSLTVRITIFVFLPKVTPKICKTQIYVIEKSGIKGIHILTSF